MAVALFGAMAPAWAQSLPRQNLWIELRWVDQDLSAAAVAGARDGSVVVSTGGTVSSRGGVTISTQTRTQRQQSLPRLMVLNGQQASITLSEVTPIQWVDIGLERRPKEDRIQAVPRQGVAERSRSFSVKPQWPGGQQPVTVEVRTLDLAPQLPPGAAMDSAQRQDSTSLLSTVQVAMGQWVTIARSGGVSVSADRNTYSTRDAEVQRLRELQLRVDVAP
ncbi:hypothetical protein [Roseateles amylovorans]|uniref:DUF4140 domain-containing protein n=1 Tax=Roseateles amylovorans TaxID=2978473 RepID=A0ABY6B0E4_9BURK|nr:hypothetical protein [Roseateles amylovorans]UXH78866.1 hypothetical protein N4261_02685 [Roseateles amylovorans]